MSSLAHPLARSAAIAALVSAAFFAGPLTARAAGDSISYDAIGYGRPAVDQEASNYCALHGKVAAFTGQIGSRYSYDCIPSSGVAYTLAPVPAPAPVVTYAPAVTYAAAPAYVAAPTTYLPAPAPAVTPATPTYVSAPYQPTPYYSTAGNGHDNPSVSYDTSRYDRLSIVTAADAYCAGMGKAAAFSGRRGSLADYDCVPNSDASHTPSALYAPVAAQVPAPYIVYEYTPVASQASMQLAAADYCSAQGRTAVFRSEDGTRITYDCVTGGSQTYVVPTTYVAYTDAAMVPNAVPTISFSTAGNSQRDSETPAIRYCNLLGKSPVLKDENYSMRTYQCL